MDINVKGCGRFWRSCADFTGRIVVVFNGDTLEVLHNQRPERVRLSDIDFPEIGQAL
jgi:endonuclease YncB( thermonuclease family)